MRIIALRFRKCAYSFNRICEIVIIAFWQFIFVGTWWMESCKMMQNLFS